MKMIIGTLILVIILLTVVLGLSINKEKNDKKENQTIEQTTKYVNGKLESVEENVVGTATHYSPEASKEYIGEVYANYDGWMLVNSNSELDYHILKRQWIKITREDIQDRLDNQIKINGAWYKQDEYFMYKDPHAEERKKIEDAINKKGNK